MVKAFAHIISQCGDILAGYGLPGVCIIVLLFACRNLFAKYIDVQEKRILESQTAISALTANTSALEHMTDAVSRKQECRFSANHSA